MRHRFSLLALTGVLLMVPLSSRATPIKVDLKKLLDHAENTPPYQYVPARAGWNGPQKPQVAIGAPVLPQQDAEVRRWLVRLSVPDPFMVLAFGVSIFGLRLLRRMRESRPVTTATA